MRKIALLIFAVLGGLLTMIGCGDNDAVITGPVGWAIGYRSDNTAAILHTANGGKNWEEQGNPALWTGLSGNDISAVDKWTAWAAVGGGPSSGGAILHTTDGGATWRMDAPAVSGPNDIDDICAPEADMVWAVQNIGGMSGGRIIRVRLVNGKVISDTMDPMSGKYQYEGVTCFDEKTVWVVGFKAYGVDPGLPEGVILHTEDGTTWTSQTLPVSDVSLWKVSFAGAHR